MTLGSNCGSGPMYWMMSWPDPAASSDSMRAGIWVLSMWSTVTLTPTFLPQSLANGSNHLSCRGTKWLHIRIFRSPEILADGSANSTVGAAPLVVGCADLSSLPQPAARYTAPAAAPWRNVRRRMRSGESPISPPPADRLPTRRGVHALSCGGCLTPGLQLLEDAGERVAGVVLDQRCRHVEV